MFYDFLLIFQIQGTKKNYESLCPCLSHQRAQKSVPVREHCACTVSRCNSVCALVCTSQNTHIYHSALGLHLCSTCLNMKDFTGTLILVSAHFLLYLFSFKATKKKKSHQTDDSWIYSEEIISTHSGFFSQNSLKEIRRCF